MPRDPDALYDILDASRMILEYTYGVDYQDFEGNQMLADAVVRRFEIIGEATKRLSREFRQAHPAVPWEDIAGMRDRVIHGYDTVDWQVVWKAVQESLPELVVILEAIIAELDEQDKPPG